MPALASIPWLAWPAAALVGVSLGMLGSGGSILTVPLLTLAAGLSPPDARATSLPIVGLVAAAGLLSHARVGRVRWRDALPFAAASLAAAFGAGALVAPLLPAGVQVACFAALMLVAAWRMAAAAGAPPAPARAPGHRLAVLGVGVLVGAVTGLLGIGGGFVIVPALVVMLAFDVREAVGTSLAVIALNCAGGLLGHLAGGGGGARVHGALVVVFAAAGVAGALGGARVAHRLPQATLKRLFALVVVLMAAVLLWRQFGT